MTSEIRGEHGPELTISATDRPSQAFAFVSAVAKYNAKHGVPGRREALMVRRMRKQLKR